MSVFFKGKNLDRINRDTFQSVEHCLRQFEKVRLNRETSAAIQVVREKLGKGEISVDEARRQLTMLRREYTRKLGILEAVSSGKECYRK